MDTIIKGLASIAPMIATVLGGPFAAAAVTALEGVFGLSNATPDQLNASVASMTPDQHIALVKANNDLQVAMETAYTNQMAIKQNVIQSSMDDEASARNMQNDSVNKVRIELIRWLGLFTLVVFAGSGFLYFRGTIQGDEGYMIGSINAGILGMWMMVLGFYFGTGVDKVMQYMKRDNINTDK